MCPSCEMVQGTVSFPTKVCEVYHVSLENESGTGIYKPLNSQDWHAHVNFKTPHDMDTVQIFNFFCTTSKLKSEGNIQ